MEKSPVSESQSPAAMELPNPSDRKATFAASYSQTSFVNLPPSDPAPRVDDAHTPALERESIRREEAIRTTAQTLGIETSVSSYRDLALSLIEDCPLKHDLVAFVDRPRQAPHESLELVDAFIADNDRTDWHTHCPDVTKKWKAFCKKISSVSDKVAVNRMAAPSGPMKARATFLWHYPTDTSPNQVFSHVMDPASPSLNVQKLKNGLRGDVKTIDLIPIRVLYKKTGPEWETTYPEWPAIEEVCVDFTQDAIKDDDFIFAIGGEVFPYLKRMIKSWGLTLAWLELDVSTKMWEKAPRIYIVRDSSEQIRKVIFWTFHGQFSFSNRKAAVGAVWDLLYNAGYELAGVPILNYGYFEWKSNFIRQRNWSNLPEKVGLIANHEMYKILREREDAEQKPCTIDLVQQCFPSLFDKTSGLLEEVNTAVHQNGYSPLEPIMRIFIRRQAESFATNKDAKRKTTPPPAPEPKKPKVTMTDKFQAYIESDTLSAAQKKGNDTKKAIVRAKYEAFVGSFEVQQAEANRLNPNKSTEHSRALPRIDQIKSEWQTAVESGLYKKVGTSLGKWCVWYSKDYPGGLRHSMDNGPTVLQPGAFDGRLHPAIGIFNKSHFRNPKERLAAAGPDEEDEYDN
ncbi:hypothetical protein FVEN_g7487 [Fusarium venenatum]|uniref:uncharacterized protein n=1 Tax=Fusarium venenatum TaxID=56646 RepID=UPI001DAF13A2|nr:hypothetical protein FVEN_g7487 [Fusarium venenatum]KAH7004538.1 hypothetical protein EDB82DRAFT_550908 [Fusarium venenatum]